MIEDNLAHPKTPAKMVSEECIGGKVVGHQCQMPARPVAVEHAMTLDRALDIENMLLRMLRVFKDYLHHRCLIGVLLVHEPSEDSTYYSYMYSKSESIATNKKGQLFQLW